MYLLSYKPVSVVFRFRSLSSMQLIEQFHSKHLRLQMLFSTLLAGSNLNEFERNL